MTNEHFSSPSGYFRRRERIPKRGDKVENIIGTNVIDYLPDYLCDTFQEAQKRMIRTGKTVQYDVPVIRGKEVIWWSTRIVPVKDEKKIAYFLLIATDVTEKKKQEQELQKKTSRLERLNESLVKRELVISEQKKEIDFLKKKLVEKTKKKVVKRK